MFPLALMSLKSERANAMLGFSVMLNNVLYKEQDDQIGKGAQCASF